MKAFVLSSPYIEECLKDHFDIYADIDIQSLYFLNENHEADVHNKVIDNGRYKIIYIAFMEFLRFCYDVNLYAVFCDELSDSVIKKLELVAKSSSKKIFVFSNGRNHEVIKRRFNEAKIVIIDTGAFSNYQTEHVFTPIYKYKPVVLVCGMSAANMQPKLELLLIEYLNRMQIEYDFLSNYLPYRQKPPQNYLSDINQLLSRICELQNNNNKLIVISLPMDFSSTSPQDDFVINSWLSRIRPDYTICCVNNDYKLIRELVEVQHWFYYKYNLLVDSFFVSDYTVNHFEYLGENRPLRVPNYTLDMNTNNSLIISNIKDSAQRIIKDMMSKISFPDCVEIIQ